MRYNKGAACNHQHHYCGIFGRWRVPGDSQGCKFNSSDPAILSAHYSPLCFVQHLGGGFHGGQRTTLLFRAEDQGEVHVLSATARLGISLSNLHGEFRHIIG